MLRKFTFWFTLFSIIVCFINYLGYDPDHLLLYFTSLPVWFIEIVRDIHSLNMALIYLLTVLSWTAAGLLVDELVAKRADARKN
ncbi:MAG TPA: hypothetical protein VGE40_00675 [Bacilli bacterium]